MKFNKILIISFIILAIFMAGSVSANDNITEIGSEELVTDDIVGDEQSQRSDDYNYSVEIPENVYAGVDSSINVTLPSGEGSISIEIDDVEKYNQPVEGSGSEIDFADLLTDLEYTSHSIVVKWSGDDTYIGFNKTSSFNYNYIYVDIPDTFNWGDDEIVVYLPDGATGSVDFTIDNGDVETYDVEYSQTTIDVVDVSFGKHNYEIKYYGGNYPEFIKKGSFNVNYKFDVDISNMNPNYGESVDVEVNLPSDVENNLIYTINGVSNNIILADGDAKFSLNNLKMGENTLVVKYNGDTVYPSQSKTFTIEVNSRIDVPEIVKYGSDSFINLVLPENAKGNVIVNIDNGEFLARLQNGRVNISLSNITIGKHNITVKYDGSDYDVGDYNSTFEVIPNIKYSNYIWVSGDNNISIELPNNATGYFILSNSTGIIANESVSNGKATINLKLEVGENQEFQILYSGDDNYDEYDVSVDISVREYSTNPNMQVTFPNEVVVDDARDINVTFNDYATGSINITIDGNLVKTLELNDAVVEFNIGEIITDLSMATHTIKIDYSGDEYYSTATYTASFNITSIRVVVPEIVIIGQDDVIEVYVPDGASGVATIYIDNKKYLENRTIEDNVIQLDLSNLSIKEYKNVNITYTGDVNFPNFQLSTSFNVTYELIVDDYKYPYGEIVEIEVELPKRASGNVELIINGSEYTLNVVDGKVKFTLDSLDMGEYNFTVNYKGDDNYPQRSANKTLVIIPEIIVPENITLIDENNVVLKLPDNANGNLTLEISDTGYNLIKNITQKLINGEASISLNNLQMGVYYVTASYTGDDYNVSTQQVELHVNPYLEYPSFKYAGDNATIIFKLPNDAKGILSISMWGDPLTFDFINGEANVLILNLGEGQVDIEISYTGDDKYGSYNNVISINVEKLKATITYKIPTNSVVNEVSYITFYLPNDATGEIEVEIDEDVFYGDVENGIANVEIEPTTSGQFVLKYTYYGDDKYEESIGYANIKILPEPKIIAKSLTMFYSDGSVYKVRILDSLGKPVVGGVVEFEIDGETYKTVKTDKKGYASVKITNSPGTYEIVTYYKEVELSKTLNIKHILKVKNFKVKKSAKKLTIKISLSKIKGKYLKGKKITIKFNGKKYKVKTNKKGVAKLTINKSVLKKLKAGKKVKFQANYLKDTIKKTIKVKK